MSKKRKEKEKEVQKAIVPDVLKDAAMARLHDEEGQLTIPVLWECLVPQFEGSTVTRPAGKLSITVEGAYWRVQLDLPYERLTCRMFVASLATALGDMNAYLGSGKAVFSPMYERNKKPLPRLDAPVE
jgi:hypothetical protein